jgi:hypothetical protein
LDLDDKIVALAVGGHQEEQKEEQKQEIPKKIP